VSCKNLKTQSKVVLKVRILAERSQKDMDYQRKLNCGGNFARELAVARNHPTGVKEVVQPAVRAADQS
jgi:hypothetical protein